MGKQLILAYDGVANKELINTKNCAGLEINKNMSSSAGGIQNFSQMNDKDKAYLVKLVGTIIAAVISGIICGTQYSEEEGASFGASESGLTGFSIWFGVTLGFAYFIKAKYDLGEMTNQKIFRHGIFIGFLSYIFFWTVFFNFLYL
ncbi:MAG: hypothetical protein ACXAD7_07800 [Candidatus Kariarchaeaceae archaeon]